MSMKVNEPNEAERHLIGSTLAGRYHVESFIAEGSLGAVVLARHVNLDEKVAIKLLRAELRREPAAIARLQHESKVLARIKSDHVTRVIDVGITLGAGPFMVMEYLQGTDLGTLLEKEGPLPVERVVEIALQICEALTVAHTAGITHGDIKPEKLFLARHGQFETLKVLGFGAANDAERTDASSRRAGAASDSYTPALPLHGTPSYMAPERVRNEPNTDHRSDIWAVGVVLHELVTGRAVFDAPTVIETCARIVTDAPLGLEPNDAVLPPSLRSIIARCLERDVERRYQNVEELAAALAPIATMNERFRGRSTGAFSRKLVEEQLALSKTQRFQLAAAQASPPAPGEISTVLLDVGVALRWVARSVLQARVYERPVWLYAVVALASSLTVAAIAWLGGNVRWVSPPPAALQGQLAPEDKHAVRGVDEPAVSGVSAEAPSDVRALEPGPLPSGAAPTEPATAAGEGAEQAPVAARAVPAARARRGHRRAVEPRKAPRAASSPVASRHRSHGVSARPSRVRLVEDKLLTNRKAKRKAGLDGADDGGADPASSPPSPPLPDWLELMRSAPPR